MKMNNRVYGVAGISCINANWNADFSGYPKTLSNGDIFGSDKAFKYSIKKLWENEGKKILYIKSYKTDKGKLQPLTNAERYEKIFGEKVDSNPAKSLSKLFSAHDVLNFGATFLADGNISYSITGAVQVMQGMNVCDITQTEVQDILSPFKNFKSDDSKQSSLGKKITVNEAHYLYGFSINPKNYDVYSDVIDGFEGYTQEAYENFKRGCLLGATALNTNSKSGCENEFAIFVKLKEEALTYLPNLADYISFEKGEDKNIFDLTKLAELIGKVKDDVESVEIYCNSINTEIKADGLECEIKEIY